MLLLLFGYHFVLIFFFFSPSSMNMKNIMYFTYLPTISSSLSLACFLIRFQISMVKRVEALLKMDVKELITAATITATINPRKPTHNNEQ